MLMKYKDFKQMTDEDMKNVMGGLLPPSGGAACVTACYKYNNTSGVMDSGTCSSGSVTVNGNKMNTCDCSISGDTSCYGAS